MGVIIKERARLALIYRRASSDLTAQILHFPFYFSLQLVHLYYKIIIFRIISSFSLILNTAYQAK